MTTNIQTSYFDNPLNINFGFARVIWAPEPSNDGKLPGWVFLGGARTQDKATAMEYAAALHVLQRKQMFAV
jgi:hypothetical protein